MNSKAFRRSIAAALLVSLVVPFAAAQIVQPTAISFGGDIAGKLGESSQRLPDGTPYDCYAVNTQAGQAVTVTLRSTALDGALRVARGALCSASAIQHDNDNFEADSQDARISFRAAGGRYLIFARGVKADAAGAYSLSVETDRPQENIVLADAGEVSRREIMEREVAQHRAKVAAEQAQQRAIEAQRRAAERERQLAEAEERRQQAYEEQQNAQTFMNALGVFSNTLANETAKYEAQAAQTQAWFDLAEQVAEDERRREYEEEQLAAADRAEATAFAVESQRRANEASRLAALQAQRDAQASAMRNSPQYQAKPADQSGGSSFSTPVNRASTNDDANRCMSAAALSFYKNCNKGSTATIVNNCDQKIEARICHFTGDGRWDCYMDSNVDPGESWSASSCAATGRVYTYARTAPSSGPWPDPQ
jgi:hypothetical protein